MDEKDAPLEEAATHRVLLNHEGQYSMWPGIKEIPLGWSAVFEGNREDCLAYVEENWVDMRPKSIREGIK